MKKVTFTFVGQESDLMAERFYTWYIDGGLEDYIIDTLTETGPSKVDTIESNNDTLDIIMGCSYQEQ